MPFKSRRTTLPVAAALLVLARLADFDRLIRYAIRLGCQVELKVGRSRAA